MKQRTLLAWQLGGALRDIWSSYYAMAVIELGQAVAERVGSKATEAVASLLSN